MKPSVLRGEVYFVPQLKFAQYVFGFDMFHNQKHRCELDSRDYIEITKTCQKAKENIKSLTTSEVDPKIFPPVPPLFLVNV